MDNWANHKVKTLEDIKAIDEEFKKKYKSNARNTKAISSNNKFNNFTARDYDFNDLEKKLVNK